jgi:heme/copper-type cytochrome/quinol oxidase subunit 3
MSRRASQRVNRRAQVGVAMFLIAEAVFFFLLILAFVYFGAIPNRFGKPGWIFTALFLASGASMWLATGASGWWRCVTIALGIAFAIWQATLHKTTFFILVGIHGLHVLAGVIALAIVPATALRAMALYWYFFIAVWLAIFLIVYLRGIA